MTTLASGARGNQQTKVTLFSQAFEDLREGDTFATQARTITETDVVMFANMTGDTLPVHTDRHWAEEHGMHGQRTANGLLTLSYTVGLLPLDVDQVVALRRMRDVVYKRPVFLGDTIHARGRIERLVRFEHFGCVTTTLRSVNQHGDVVVRGTFEMLWKLGSHEQAQALA